MHWLTRSLADVPPGDAWLSGAEREAMARLRFPKRRRDWRLGRFTAKAAVASWLQESPSRLEILAGPGGAPAAWLDGAPAGVSVSLSHRGDRALAVVARAPAAIGCDLELLEPRTAAFVDEWLAPSERNLVALASAGDRALVANLVWTAKEAAAKARGDGLRLDVRSAVVEPDLDRAGSDRGWRPLRVTWPSGRETDRGFWRTEPGWVMSVVGS